MPQGVLTHYSFDPASLRLSHVLTTGAAGQDYGYLWDRVGNLKQRTKPGTQEVFNYDPLNRLDTVTLNGGNTPTLDVDYDPNGNITRKQAPGGSDVGTYSYGTNGGGPHAVSAISALAQNPLQGLRNAGILLTKVPNRLMGRVLQYVYFRISCEARRLRRSGPDNSRDLTTILMSAVDGMYIGAAGVVILKLANAPIPAPYWRYPFAISYTVILLIAHHFAFATPGRDRMIREHFSTYPIPEKLGTILVLAWFFFGPACLSLAGALR